MPQAVKPNPNTASLMHKHQNHWYRNYVVWMLILLPLIGMVISLSHVYEAYNGRDDEIQDDWYMNGKSLEQDLSRDTASAMAGLTATAMIDANHNMTVKLSSDLPIDRPDALTVNFYHIAHAKKDTEIILNKTSQGYTGKLPELNGQQITGKYTVSLSAGNWRLIQPSVFPTKQIEFKFDPSLVTVIDSAP